MISDDKYKDVVTKPGLFTLIQQESKFMIQIVETFMEKEFCSIPDLDLMDFLPAIDTRKKAELAILKTWTDHFVAKKVPFQIMRNGHKITLWKEREGG